MCVQEAARQPLQTLAFRHETQQTSWQHLRRTTNRLTIQATQDRPQDIQNQTTSHTSQDREGHVPFKGGDASRANPAVLCLLDTGLLDVPWGLTERTGSMPAKLYMMLYVSWSWELGTPKNPLKLPTH